MAIRRVGIMTGGGDCPGLNAVIRAAVLTGVRQYGWEILGIEDAFSGLVDLDYRSPHGNRWLTEADVQDIHVRGGTILGTSNTSDPFHYVVERDGERVETDRFDQVLDNFRALDLDALISIGGDGSMRIAQQCIDRGLTQIVGVPKTIDNDLGATDYTFGFDTAVQVATEALDRVHDTARSHDRVMIVEVMGRDAGFIALQAGLAGGAHAILLPEIPYRVAPLVDLIRARRAEGMPYSVLVVAEGAKPLGGEASTLGPREAGAMVRLVGAGQRVAAALADGIEQDCRVTVLGHIQRGGSPSNFDRVLGTRFGEAAARQVAAEDFGTMVALRGLDIVSVDLAQAAGTQKRVDPDGAMVRAARAMGVCFG